MKRRFKLRNGAIVEEWRRENTIERGGFIDDYRIIDYGDMSKEDRIGSGGCDNWLCLGFGEDFPVSHTRGKSYDIVEEIFETPGGD
jgi:hypothetical protein